MPRNPSTGNITAQGRAQMVNAMAVALVQQDALLRHELKSIVNGALKHMAYTLVHGSEDAKMALTKSLMPHLLSGLHAAETSDADIARGEAYERMKKMMRGEITMDDLGKEDIHTPRAATPKAS